MWRRNEINIKKIRNGRPFVKSFNFKRTWLVILILVFVCVIFMNKEQQYNVVILRNPPERRTYDSSWRNLTADEKNKLSTLGRILYLEEGRPPENKKEYKVLFWKYGKYIKNRHLNYFSSETHDPLKSCSVRNCKFSFNDKDLKNADIVIFHLHRMKGVGDLPPKRESLDQIWAFLTDESPYNTFLGKKVKITDFNGKFNWSMTYRMDSDIPVPYGRARKFTNSVSPYNPTGYLKKRRDKLVTILGSNCHGQNKRWQYVKKLKKFIDVDVYGGCGNKTACPGHFKSDCPVIDNYLFYLSFENSDCREYLTEKIFWNAYYKNSIPVIMGYNKKTYQKLLPPESFLHVDEFAQPKDLADYILFLNKTEEYKQYYTWDQQYEIINEHGYFGSNSYHFCRICEAMNFNKKGLQIYEDLSEFWDKSKDCSIRE